VTTLPDTGVDIYAYPGSDTMTRLTLQAENAAGVLEPVNWRQYAKISFTVYPVPDATGTPATPLGTINSVDNAALFDIQDGPLGLGTRLFINISRMVLPVLPAPKGSMQAARNYYEVVLKGHSTLTSLGDVIADGKIDTSRPTLFLRVYAGSEI